MKRCEQAPGFSIYDHGLDVANRYRDLHRLVRGEAPLLTWKLTERITDQLRLLLPLAASPEEARLYHLMHDCGKPSCLQLDEHGRRHFPGHAERSFQLFSETFPDRPTHARWIAKDMLCHTARGGEVERLAQDPDAPTLCLTAWAELHSNAEHLFGGFESDSFKIKLKRLEKLTKQIAEAHSLQA